MTGYINPMDILTEEEFSQLIAVMPRPDPNDIHASQSEICEKVLDSMAYLLSLRDPNKTYVSMNARLRELQNRLARLRLN